VKIKKKQSQFFSETDNNFI